MALYRIMFLAETDNNIMMPRITNVTKCINAGVTYNDWIYMFTQSPFCLGLATLKKQIQKSGVFRATFHKVTFFIQTYILIRILILKWLFGIFPRHITLSNVIWNPCSICQLLMIRHGYPFSE